MTREEAIRIFRKEIECLSHTKCEDCILEKACDPMNTTPYDSEYIEAYSMAIKALEQEPTTKNDLGVDCISRAEAKAAIRDKFKDLPSRVEINTILNELPSVTPQEPILDKIFCITHPLSIMSTPELEHKAMQIAEMLEPLCLLESEDK